MACALGGQLEDRIRKALLAKDVPSRDMAIAWRPLREQLAVWSINEELIFFLNELQSLVLLLGVRWVFVVNR